MIQSYDFISHALSPDFYFIGKGQLYKIAVAECFLPSWNALCSAFFLPTRFYSS